MNRILSFFRSLRTGLIAVANDVQMAIANADGGTTFEIAQGDSFFVPFGRHPHAKGLQIFDRASAEALKAAANSMTGKTLGIPIYIGHPDVPGRPDTNPSAPAVGWVQDIEIENDGVRLVTKFGQRGADAVANAEYRFYSPHWLAKPVTGGISPVRLLSVGLTNKPRIPVPAIANDQTQTEEPMKLTPTLLALLGLDAAANDGNGPTEEEIITAATALETRLTTAENDLTAARTRADQAETDLQEIRPKLTTAENDLTAAVARVAGVRTALVDTALDRIVAAGRLAQADRDAKRAELLALENDEDITAAITKIETEAPTLKTKSALGDVSKAKATVAAANDATARSVERQKAVDAELQAMANDTPAATRHNEAWLRAQRKHPHLFTATANA